MKVIFQDYNPVPISDPPVGQIRREAREHQDVLIVVLDRTQVTIGLLADLLAQVATAPPNSPLAAAAEQEVMIGPNGDLTGPEGVGLSRSAASQRAAQHLQNRPEMLGQIVRAYRERERPIPTYQFDPVDMRVARPGRTP